MPLPEIEEILKKFEKEEEKIEDLCKKLNKRQDNEVDVEETKEKKFLTYEEAKERNKNLLKDLETVKGNLRSKAIFSPIEMQWETICKRYQEEPSLPVTTWRCNIPIFV